MEKELLNEAKAKNARKRSPATAVKIYFIIVAIVLLLSMVYAAISNHELPRGIVAFRNWFHLVGIAGIMIWQVLMIIGTCLICTRVFTRTDARRARYTGRALSMIVCVLTIGVLALLWIAGLLRLDEEMVNDNGTITVSHSSFLDETEYSLWKPEGVLYRRYLRVSAGPEDVDPSMTREMFIREHWPERDHNESAEPFTASAEDTPTETEQISDELLIQTRIYDGLVAVYSQLAADEQAYSYRYRQSDSTHGEPRVILYEDDKIVRFLQYDRISANNKCFLYVYYEASMAEDGTWSATEAQILDMYAYVIDSGEVVASGKQSWSAPGSDIYREASGE